MKLVKKQGSLLKKNPLLAKELHKNNNIPANEIPIKYEVNGGGAVPILSKK